MLTFTSFPASSLSEIFGNASPTFKMPAFEVELVVAVAVAFVEVSDFDFFVAVAEVVSLSVFDLDTGADRFLLLDAFAPSLPFVVESEGKARFAIREDVLRVDSVADMINNNRNNEKKCEMVARGKDYNKQNKSN